MTTDRLSKGIRILSRINAAAERAFDDHNMPQFLHHAFRYIEVHAAVFPGAKRWSPGDVLDEIIEKQVFFSRL